MRLRSDIWVAAYLRRCAVEGVASVLRRRGAPEAGAIFVKIDRMNGEAAVYGPAPQTQVVELPPGVDRLFSRQHKPDWIEASEAERRLEREISFDPDLWIVEVEDRDGHARLDLAAQ